MSNHNSANENVINITDEETKVFAWGLLVLLPVSSHNKTFFPFNFVAYTKYQQIF